MNDPSTAGTGYDTMAKNVAADLCKEEAVVELPLVECRICLDEDIVSEMEIPCECRGNLMYAHKSKTCIHKWMRNLPSASEDPGSLRTDPDHDRELCENEDMPTIAQAFEPEQLNVQQDRACLRFLLIISFQVMLLLDAAVVVLSHLRSHKWNHTVISMSYAWWSFFIAAEISILVLMGLVISTENHDGRRIRVSRGIHGQPTAFRQ